MILKIDTVTENRHMFIFTYEHMSICLNECAFLHLVFNTRLWGFNMYIIVHVFWWKNFQTGMKTKRKFSKIQFKGAGYPSSIPVYIVPFPLYLKHFSALHLSRFNQAKGIGMGGCFIIYANLLIYNKTQFKIFGED